MSITRLLTGDLNGTPFEIGWGATTGADVTIEVPTQLSEVTAADVTYREAPGATSQVLCDCVITSGKVTVAGLVAQKEFSYLFLGPNPSTP